MFIDHYLPKRLEGVRNTLLTHYLQTTTITESKEILASQALACIIYNSSYCLSSGRTEFTATLRKEDFAKPLIINGNHIKRKVSHTWFRRVLLWMEEESYLEVDVGGVESFKQVSGRLVAGTKRNTVVRLSESLVELLSPVSSKQDQEILKSVLELRDSDGNPVTYKITEQHKRLISLLDMYNTYLRDTSIRVGDQEFLIQGKKVFNGDFSQGGRTYVIGAQVMHSLLTRENRSKILINHQPTVEIDLKASHLSLIAEMEGFVFEEGFDPYGVEMSGYDSKCLREIAKLAILCLINSKSVRQAKQALSLNMYQKLPLPMWKEENLVPDVVGASRVIEEVTKHNPYAVKYFGEGVGLHLQGLEARILDYVIEYFLEKGVVLLVIHDSIVIQGKYEEEAITAMKKGYELVMGSNFNCNLEVKTNE